MSGTVFTRTMPSTHSAGIVLYRPALNRGEPGAEPGIEHRYEVLLVHPGGPFWANKDEHGWSIPKGEFDPDAESAEEAARREFAEELGRPVPPPVDEPSAAVSDTAALPPFKAGRKTIHAVLKAGDFDADQIESNTVEIEWPPRSGRMMSIPEVDRAAWFTLDEARTRLHKGQVPLIDLVVAALVG